MNIFSLQGKTALITGGAQGIGLACAQGLASYGADIILVDISEDSLKEALHVLPKAKIIVCDVSNGKSVERMMKIINKRVIDVFINSAAITNRKPILEMTDEEWDHIIAVNLGGAHHLGKAIASHMINHKTQGRMIFIVSTGAFRASVNFGAYSASKAGVVMMMKTFALELAPYHILCNAIAPTATDTAFTRDYYEKYPDKRRKTEENHPLGRIGRPEDYQGAAIYLSSQASAFVTGTVLVVDGGKTAK